MPRKITIPENQDELLTQHVIEKRKKEIKTAEEYRALVRAGIGTWAKKFKAGEIEINTVSDLRELTELDFYLQDK